VANEQGAKMARQVFVKQDAHLGQALHALLRARLPPARG
jgi:hypothetical protein